MLLINYWKAAINILIVIFSLGLIYSIQHIDLDHYFTNILCHNICHYDYLCVFLVMQKKNDLV